MSMSMCMHMYIHVHVHVHVLGHGSGRGALEAARAAPITISSYETYVPRAVHKPVTIASVLSLHTGGRSRSSSTSSDTSTTRDNPLHTRHTRV